MGAAGLVAKFRHPPAPRKISKPVQIPIATNVVEATDNIAKIATLAAAGEIGLDEGADLVKFLESFIAARTEGDHENRLQQVEELLDHLNPPATVEVSGGLPELPIGPDDPGVIMPQRTIPVHPDRDKP
jgi:hypothetical protein